MSEQTNRGNWGSKLGFILAATGSAVGLGNLWKFPYITYENGGGAFVIIYLIAIAIIGFPIMIAELVVGKSTQKNPLGAFRDLAAQSESPLAKFPWMLIGAMGIITGFIILSYYSVVAGWTVEYFFRGITGQFTGLNGKQMVGSFVKFVGNPYKQVMYHTIFMGLTCGIVIFGVGNGIERATKVLMPILIIMILIIMGYSASIGNFSGAVSFLFNPNFSKISASGILEAVGHAFFTLSLGMGAMLTYGSYLRKDDTVVQPAVAITVLDTLVALMACLMIYPILFGNFGFKATSGGAGVLFHSLPVVFGKLSMGWLVAGVFFLLVAFAALSSTISLLEVVVSWGCDELGWNRNKATIAIGGAIYLFGLPSALSNGASKFFSTPFLWNGEKYLAFMDAFDYIASNWLLPIGGLLVALFVGYVMDKKMLEQQQPDDGLRPLVSISHIFLRYVSPVLVFIVLLNKIGVIKMNKPQPHKKQKAKPSKAREKAAKRAKTTNSSTVHKEAPPPRVRKEDAKADAKKTKEAKKTPAPARR